LDLLFSQNKNEDKCFRIKAGEAYVVRETSGGNIHLCTLEAGDFIGAIPFLNTSHEPYSANVYASADLETDLFDLSAVRREYEMISETFKNMVEYLSTSISVTTGRILDLTRKKKDQEPKR
jgi:CRP-like cAMP-binding protein